VVLVITQHNLPKPSTGIGHAIMHPALKLSLADEAASFLAIKRRYLLALARNGIAGAYALGTGTVRKVWVFRLSELAAAIAGKNSDPKMRELCDPASGSPR
jgi:hypothetical protein